MNSFFNLYLKKIFFKYKKIKNKINYKNIFENKEKFLFLLKKYNSLKNIIDNYLKLKEIDINIKDIESISYDKELYDSCFNELKLYYKNKKKIKEKILNLLTKNKKKYNVCYLEIKSGTGGDESSFFVKDLFNIYIKYIENKKWNVNIINLSFNKHGGYKEVVIKILSNKAYEELKFESGGHRVQRIPETENQGRIHTSTCTVAVIPEIKKTFMFRINFKDIKIYTFRSSGAGGQHVNTTDSAIRIKHIPTGVTVECQNERSQHKNKEQALILLKSKLLNILKNKENKKMSNIKRNLLGSGYRSDRIRTYNYKNKKITDHRLNLTLNFVDRTLINKLNIIIEKLKSKYFCI